jgi:glutamate-5-semialdehyde dehydrogenase
MVRKIVADASVPVALDPDPGTPRAYVGALGSSDDVDLAVELATRSWSVLLQRDAVEQVLPVMLSALDDAGIGVWADAAVIAADGGHDLSEAGPEDFSGHSSAGSSSRVVVGIVADADAALDHLRAHPGTGTEAVVTADAAAAARFAAAAPADVVLVNALGAGEVRAPWSTATLTRWRWVVTDPADGEGT